MIIRKLKTVLNSVAMQLFVTQITVAASALIVNVFAARALGPEARGELALFMQIAYVTNAVVVLGRHRAYLKLGNSDVLVASSSQKNIRFLSRLPLLLSAVAALILAAIWADGLLSGVVFALGMFSLVYSGVQQKTIRASAIVARTARPFFLSTVIGQVLLLVGSVTLSLNNVSDVPVWLLLYGGSVMLPYLLVSIVLTVPSESLRSPQITLNRVKLLGLKLMPMSVAEILGSRADRFLIPVLANFTQLGIYTVVVTMTELVAWPIKNYTDSKVPEWSREISHSRFRVFKEVATISGAVILLAFLIGGLLNLLLVPLFGIEYQDGKDLIWPLVISAALHAWSQFGANVSLAAGFTTLTNAIPITGMVASTVSYLFLIPLFGALGAAWGLIIGYSAAILVSLIGFAKIVQRLND